MFISLKVPGGTEITLVPTKRRPRKMIRGSAGLPTSSNRNGPLIFSIWMRPSETSPMDSILFGGVDVPAVVVALGRLPAIESHATKGTLSLTMRFVKGTRRDPNRPSSLRGFRGRAGIPQTGAGLF